MIKNLKSEKGVVLAVVLVLSAVALIIITTLVYMVTVGTQTSGFQRKYRTSLEAGIAGSDVLAQAIELRGNITTLATLNPVVTTPNTCAGKTLAELDYQGIEAKILTSSTTWSSDCDTLDKIDTDVQASYDLKFKLGTNPQYTVYTKIVDNIEGNTSSTGTPVSILLNKGVVSSNSGGGEISIMKVPYQFTILVDAVNDSKPDEKAKLSILYQY